MSTANDGNFCFFWGGDSNGAVAELLPPWGVGTAPGAKRRPGRRKRVCKARPGRVSLVERHLLAGVPVVQPGGNLAPRYRMLKRYMDILGAVALLVPLAPVMLAIWLILLITTRGKPLFWQRRAGYLGRPFMMAKFRTMRLDAERVKHAVRNEVDGLIFKNRRDPRITRFGRFLRKTSLDELPQLLHVLGGQMSLVGPRPLDLKEVTRFAAWHRRRLAVLPGLTCLWQISGRSDVDFENTMRMDLWYVRHQGLWADLKLLLLTPLSVLRGRGAY